MSLKNKELVGNEGRKTSESKAEIPPEEVGVVIVPNNTSQDATIRALLRAELTKYEALLMNTECLDTSVIGIAEELDIPVIEASDPKYGFTEHYTFLESVAQTTGIKQLIVQDSISSLIDYERTERNRLETESFIVSAVAKSTRESSQSIIAAIPAYNEAGTIKQVVEETKPHVDKVIVIDDGSEDDTTTVADAAGAKVIEHETNSGYGAALTTAFRTAAKWDVDQLVILDGDGQHEPSDIPRLVDRQKDTGSEVVIGSRLCEHGETDIPLYRRFGLEVINTLTNVSMGAVSRKHWVKDTQSGFRLYDRTAIESLAADSSIGSGMNASTDILYHGNKQNYDVEEVGTTIYYDVEDGSTVNPVTHGVGLVANILNTIERERPVLFVGVPGFFLAVFGIFLGYISLSNFLATDTFPLGVALGSSVIFLTGLFLGLTATVLHALKQYLGNNDETIRNSLYDAN